MNELKNTFEFSAVVSNFDDLKKSLGKHPFDAIFHSGILPYVQEELENLCVEYKDNLTIYDDNGASIYYFRFGKKEYYEYMPFALSLEELRQKIEITLKNNESNKLAIEWINQEFEDKALISKEYIRETGIDIEKTIKCNKILSQTQYNDIDVDFSITTYSDSTIIKIDNYIEVLQGNIIAVDENRIIHRYRIVNDDSQKCFLFIISSTSFPFVIFYTLTIDNNPTNLIVYFDDCHPIDKVENELKRIRESITYKMLFNGVRKN